MWVHGYVWHIVDWVCQPALLSTLSDRLTGSWAPDPEIVMGTQFNWGNRRAFRDLLIKGNPSHRRAPQQRQTGKQSDSSASPSSVFAHIPASKTPNQRAGMQCMIADVCADVCM